MRAMPVPVLLLLVGMPSAVRAEDCKEARETCLENCRIDLGMTTERERLARCVKRCQTSFEDCRDFDAEERVNQARLKEKAPEERQHRGPVDVAPADDYRGETVRKEKDEPQPTRAEDKKTYKFESTDDPPAGEQGDLREEDEAAASGKKRAQPPKKSKRP